MKIGLVRRGFSETGGAESYLKRLAHSLIEEGHECILFAGNRWKQEMALKTRVVSLRGKSPRQFADALERAREEQNCDFIFSLERVLRCDCYRAGDGVHRAWLERRKKIEPFWKSWGRAWFNTKHREMLALEAELMTPAKEGGKRGSRAIIANSQMVKAEILAHYSYPADRIHVIYNGLPERKADPEARDRIRAKLGIGKEDYVLIFAGSGWERKGLKFAIEAVRKAKLSQALLLVAGRGNPGAFPENERVRFLGPVKEMDAHYAAADVMILPTVYDPFSNACLEALGAGLPVITTRSNGFSEIVRAGEEADVIGDPRDTDAIARAIEGWSDPQRRAAIKPQLFELASRFSMDVNVRATLHALAHLRAGEESRGARSLSV